MSSHDLRLRRLAANRKAEIARLVAARLAHRGDIQFAVLHGSFVERDEVRDLDVAVCPVAGAAEDGNFLDYELALAADLQADIEVPVDVKTVTGAPSGFRYEVTKGRLLYVRDPEAWFGFRERTWREYFDFEPLAKQSLRDLLAGSEEKEPRST